VFVDEEETEATVEEKTEQKSEFVEPAPEKKESAQPDKVSDVFKERLVQYKKTLQKQLSF
jgi:G2/mitotic-specific cyclin-B, other